MDPRKLSTEELVRLCLASRDEDLWTEFVRRFQPLIAGVIVKRFSRYRRPNPDLVDDLAQDTFLKICEDNFRRLRKFEFREQGEKGFYAFLKVMADNVVKDFIRKKKSDKVGGDQEPENIDDLPQGPSDRSKSVASIFYNLRMSEIDNCLLQLAGEPNFARDYKIFWFYFRDGLTAQAISQLPDMGLTVKGVESTLLRLIKWLRGKLRKR